MGWSPNLFAPLCSVGNTLILNSPTTSMRKSYHSFFARTRSAFLSIIWVLSALTIAFLIVLRLSLPNADRLRPNVERWLHTIVGESVSIGSLDASWRGWTPELKIKDLRLSNSTEDAPHIQLLQAEISIDLLSFFKTGASWEFNIIRTERLLFSGVSFTVIRGSDGALRLAGTQKSGSAFNTDALGGFLCWLLEQPRIDVDSADIYWHDEGNEDISFFFPNTHFGIRKNGTRHQILATTFPHWSSSLQASLSKTVGSIGRALSGVADITVDPSLNWSGDIFLRIEDLELNRLPPLPDTLGLQTVSGVANFGFWTLWDKGQLKNIQGDFALRDFTLGDADLKSNRKGQPVDLPEKNICTSACNMPELNGIAIRKVSGSLELGRINTNNWQLQLNQFVLATSQGEWSSTHAELQFSWLRNQYGWLLETQGAELTNKDLTIRLMGSGQWFDDCSSPDLRLMVEINNGNLNRLTRYLPTGLMQESLVEWLAYAFPKGQLTHGEILFYGQIADFPFDNGTGIFEARLKTSNDTVLKYAKAWSPLRSSETDVVFSNRTLTVTTNSGFVYGTKVQEVIAEIPDIVAETPILNIHGRTIGNLAEGLAFLKTGPLANQYRHRVAGIQGTGKYKLDVKIKLPLPPHAQAWVQGDITLFGSTLKIDISQICAIETETLKADDDAHLFFEKVKGVLTFGKNGIAGKSITARYSNQPVTFNIEQASDQEDTTRFTLLDLDTDTLFAYPLLKNAIQEMPPSLLSFTTSVTSKASWQIVLDLPNSWGKADNQKAARLQISSPLHGTTVDLPVPLMRPFQAEVLLTQGEPRQRITVQFGPKVTAIFVPTTPSKHDHGKWRGVIRLGEGPVNFPTKVGVHVNGHVEYLSLDQWTPLLVGLAESESLPQTSDSPVTQMLASKAPHAFHFDIEIDQFIAFTQKFQNIQLKADQADNGTWYIQMQSDGTQGHIRIPKSYDNEPIMADFTRLQLSLVDDDPKKSNFKSKKIPPIQFSCKDFTYDTLPLGVVKLKILPDAKGLEIKDISIKSEDFQIQGQGSWKQLLQSENTQSTLQVEIHGKDLGKLLSSFGYEGSVAEKGKTRLQLDVEWPGSPTQFELEKMSGTLGVKITDGRLLAIEPGATGRAFGLLSITLLPRRLLLDFSDLFEKGFVYDRMKGVFRIEKGNAETDGFSVESATARIDIVGTTGLVSKNYDQVATVVPKVASSIPLAPIGLAQRLFDEPFFDEIFTNQYTIEGTWDDPKIERVLVDDWYNESDNEEDWYW